MSLCKECEKREICQTLCPEAELYAAQDEVKWTEAPISYYRHGDVMRCFNWITDEDYYLFSATEKAVLSRLGEGKTKAEISKEMDISRGYLKKIIQRLRTKAGQLST